MVWIVGGCVLTGIGVQEGDLNSAVSSRAKRKKYAESKAWIDSFV